MSSVSFGLEEKVIVITGGSRGIGLDLAKWSLKEKAKVAICARKKEGLDKATSELGNHSDLLAIEAHIAKEDQVDDMFVKVIDTFGRIDVLINNVGMNLLTSSIAETDSSLWQKIIDSNLNGAFFCARKAANLMKEQGSGKIINITSLAARKSSPGMGTYGIAKSAIEMMTKVMASELASNNIQVNAVAPGMVRTGFSAPFWTNDSIYKEICKTIPAGRIAETIDVVHPVLFLASEASNFINGQTLIVDGGQSVI